MRIRDVLTVAATVFCAASLVSWSAARAETATSEHASDAVRSLVEARGLASNSPQLAEAPAEVGPVSCDGRPTSAAAAVDPEDLEDMTRALLPDLRRAIFRGRILKHPLNVA